MPKLMGISGWVWLLIGVGAFLGVPWWKRRTQSKAAEAHAREQSAAYAHPPSGPNVPVYPQDYGLPIIEAPDSEGKLTTPLLVSGGGSLVTQAGVTQNLKPGSIYVIPGMPPTESDSTGG